MEPSLLYDSIGNPSGPGAMPGGKLAIARETSVVCTGSKGVVTGSWKGGSGELFGSDLEREGLVTVGAAKMERKVLVMSLTFSAGVRTNSPPSDTMGSESGGANPQRVRPSDLARKEDRALVSLLLT